MSHEIWKSIAGYEGKYEVSNLGRVRSLVLINKHTIKQRKNPKILRQSAAGSNGLYKKVSLSKDNKVYCYGVHRLVLTAFIGPPPDKYHGVHLDNNPSNNLLVNLQWRSQSENEMHKWMHGTKAWGEKQGNSFLTENQVRQIRKLRLDGYKLKDLAELFKTSQSNIGEICSGKSWKYLAQDDEMEKK